MKSQTLILIAAGVAAVYLLTRPRSVAAAPGAARPSTSSPTPGTTAVARLENAGNQALDRLANTAADRLVNEVSGWFAERPPVSSYDPSIGLYNF